MYRIKVRISKNPHFRNIGGYDFVICNGFKLFCKLEGRSVPETFYYLIEKIVKSRNYSLFVEYENNFSYEFSGSCSEGSVRCKVEVQGEMPEFLALVKDFLELSYGKEDLFIPISSSKIKLSIFTLRNRLERNRIQRRYAYYIFGVRNDFRDVIKKEIEPIMLEYDRYLPKALLNSEIKF